TGLPLDHHLGLAPVRLHRLRPGERKRQVHLRRIHQPLPLADILSHRALASGETVLLTEPLVDPASGMLLLRLHAAVLFYPPVDDYKVRAQHWIPGLGEAFPLLPRSLEITADRLTVVPRPPADLAIGRCSWKYRYRIYSCWTVLSTLSGSLHRSGLHWVDRGGPILHHTLSKWDTFRVAFTQYLRSHPGPYDWVVLDAYYSDSIPFHLTTQEFFQEVREALAPGGIVISNVISALAGRDAAFLAALVRTLETVFPQVYLFPAEPAPPDVRQNVIVVATLDEARLGPEELIARAQVLEIF